MVYFKKTKPAPNSLKTEKLKRNGKYNKDDVVKQLAEDFYGKCYICEDKSSSLNVEHFMPHKGNDDLKFDWDNLFLACSHCNNVKLDKFDNILNCTIKDHCVDTAIAYKFNPFPKEKPIFMALNDDKATKNTVALLDKVFNEDFTQIKSIESINLRDRLLKSICEFQKLLIDYYKIDNKEMLLEKIKIQLNKSSEFTAFKRYIIRNNKTMKQDFEKYIKD